MSLFDSRSAGVSIPLTSLRSERDWGVGDFADISAFAAWMRSAGLRDLALLPLTECALGQESPYAALSAFALDPLLISLEGVEDFRAIGGIDALSSEQREEIEHLRAAPRVQHGPIRRLKMHALRKGHRHFSSLPGDDERHREFLTFRELHQAWLPDYALFRAIKERLHPEWWLAWPEPIRCREASALQEVRTALADDVSFFEYVQWQAFGQLERARTEARHQGVRFLGDLPFVVAIDSADAWSRQEEFSTDETLGAPPDPYADEGQDWGLPSYRWERVRSSGWAWMKQRAREASRLYDAARVDHVVGLYRSYVIPRDGAPPHFEPPDEETQRAQGEAILEILREEGLALVAEDLGTVPPFVRESLGRLGIPGFRVLRWEKDGPTYRDPAGWPPLSVATTGTHDTESLASWWDGLSTEEKQAFRSIPSLAADWEGGPPFCEKVRNSILELLYASPSRLLLLPVQDLFGFRDRINLPGTVGPENWAYRLPWTLEEMGRDPFVKKTADELLARARRHGRCSEEGSTPI